MSVVGDHLSLSPVHSDIGAFERNFERKKKKYFFYKDAVICSLMIVKLNEYNAPVISNPGPYGAVDSGDIAGLKCRDLTSDEFRQCRRCTGVLISR